MPEEPLDRAIFELADLASERERSGKPYLEFLRAASLSAGLYELAAGATDSQTAHNQHEIYCVLRGRALFYAGREAQPVGAGSVIFVRAGVEHHFEKIEEDLRLLVVFSPPES